jgi:two-component system cell cycle response regulator
LSELRSRPKTKHSAILMMIPKDAREKSATALDLGANDLMIDGIDPEEMALRLKTQIRRKRQSDRLRETVRDGLRLAVIDPLTGLYNRRYAEPHLLRIAERARETGRPFAVMVLDLDRFKTINDTYGHSAGDVVLQEVAARIKDNLRGVDMVARIGGEEFLVVMPDTQLDQARMAAERLCRVVNEAPVATPNTQTAIPVSLSIGVAMGGLRDDTQSVEQLIEFADRALYAAKSDGRNQVTFSRSAA